MPIKQIQLRGISRTPSDRASADGGCAESLNVHLDQNETAPTLPAKDITDEKLGSSYISGEVIYIHKTPSMENYIVLDSGSIYAYINKVRSSSIVYIGSTVTITGVSHIGNTLLILANNQRWYMIFKNGAYTYLGNDLPVPKIEFDAFRPYGNHARVKSEVMKVGPGDEILNHGYDFEASGWNAVLSAERHGSLTPEMETKLTEIRDIQTHFWALLDEARRENRGDGMFTLPTLARFALRMYDGEYIHVSAPIFLGAGAGYYGTDGFPFRGYGDMSVEGDVYTSTLYLETYPFIVKAFLKNWDIGNWGDYIESIDLFLSQDCSYPSVNSGFYGMSTDYPYVKHFLFDDSDTFEKKILNRSLFYKIASFDKDHLSTLQYGYNLLTNPEMERNDKLVEQEELDADCSPQIIPLDVESYNERFMLAGVLRVYSTGYIGYFAPMAGQSVQSAGTNGVPSIKIKYYITDENGYEHKVLGRDANGGTTISAYYWSYSSSTYYAIPHLILFYPDARCTKVEIEFNGKVKTCQMKAHPRLNCAYYIEDVALNQTPANTGSISAGEDTAANFKNKLCLTKSANPFVLDTGSTIRFNDKIVATALATKALSEGQYGQYPVYVFTEGGVYSVELSTEGTFIASHPVSRDVALPGTILQIDQAVVFTTERGVMLLQGSDVSELSAIMLGRHYTNPVDVSTLLSTSDWSGLLACSNDNDPFMAFMRTAKAAYDYSGARIIFFRDDKNYQYVYMLRTATWHKISNSYTKYGILNSSPKCIVCAVGQPTQHRVLRITGFQEDQEGSTIYVRSAVADILAHELHEDEDEIYEQLGRLPARFEVSSQEEAAISPLLYSTSGVAYEFATETATGAYLLDFSTVLSDAAMLSDSANPIKGMIATRPIDLGEPDIRKAIRSIRIRGNFNRRDVQYVLMGSFDGVHWKRLTSLYGGSYKLFRLILLTNLTPTERITWIDVDYESRFANKLR